MRILLPSVVLNDWTDPSDMLVLPAWVEVSRTPAGVSITKQVTASRRIRSVVGDPTPEVWSVKVDYADADTRSWLESHVGRVVCARDPSGHKMFGDIAVVPQTHVKITGDLWHVDFTVTEVSLSEAV